MSSTLETKVVTAIGFRDGRRHRPGDTFLAPRDETAGWFASAGSPEAAKAAPGGEDTLLDKSVAEILAVVPGLTNAEILRLISDEQGGKTRKSLMAKLQDELDNRATRGDTGGEENPFA